MRPQVYQSASRLELLAGVLGLDLSKLGTRVGREAAPVVGYELGYNRS